MIPPFGRVLEQGLDWFFVATEVCGGTSDLGFFLGVSVFIGFVGVGFTSEGSTSQPQGRRACPRGVGAPSTLVDDLGLFWPNSGTLWASFGPKIISVKFQVNWTPFGFPFLRYSKTRKKQKLALGSRLIG